MEVIFLGVGEAFDEDEPNTSILVRGPSGKDQSTLLLDCGFSVPPQFWKQRLPADELDGVWVSHFHGDHTFGLPALIVRFWEESRRKPLLILGQKGVEDYFHRLMDVAYQGFGDRLKFTLDFREIEPGRPYDMFGLTLESSENGHTRRDLALKISDKGTMIYYSGDGRPTEEGLALAAGCDLMIQESFHPEITIPGHGTVKEAIEAALHSRVPNLALVHIQREMRSKIVDRVRQGRDIPAFLNVFVPDLGDRVVF